MGFLAQGSEARSLLWVPLPFLVLFPISSALAFRPIRSSSDVMATEAGKTVERPSRQYVTTNAGATFFAG